MPEPLPSPTARRKVWTEVSTERLAQNFRATREAAGPDTEVLAVVKANAYGHGAPACSVALAQAGALWLGVTDAEEGKLVRLALRAGIPSISESLPEILVMCGLLPDDVATIAEYTLTPVVWTIDQLRWLRDIAPIKVHVEVDTGMGRQGIQPGPELDSLLDEIAAAGVTLDGILTHFCASEQAHSSLTQTQERRFEAAIQQVRTKAVTPSWIHAGNSSTVDNPAQASPWLVDLARSVGARALVRTGLALYGYCLPIEPAPNAPKTPVSPQLAQKLLPVMTWKTRVLAVRDLAAGETVGYGATFIAPSAMRVALLPVGYADGLRRELSSTSDRPGGWTVLRDRHGAEHKAPILGRISMNLTVVDITAIDGVATGDDAILLGDGITAEDHARLACTIPYEILCAVRER
jgi:alanine racemase